MHNDHNFEKTFFMKERQNFNRNAMNQANKHRLFETLKQQQLWKQAINMTYMVSEIRGKYFTFIDTST